MRIQDPRWHLLTLTLIGLWFAACTELPVNETMLDVSSECTPDCPDGARCIAGSCVTVCDPGETLCEDGCVDLRTSRGNCGGCGQLCEDGEICDGAGSCALSCQSALTDCDGLCINLDTDPQACGACDQTCPQGNVCNGEGFCGLTCQKGLSNCGGRCTDIVGDRFNCGGCGVICGEPLICSSGECVATCASGLTRCDDRCKDLNNDPKSCGGCGITCESGAVCDGAGACSLECSEGLEKCDEACIDPQLNREHCGGCGQLCEKEEACLGGACVFTCPEGQSPCGDECVALHRDALNCGACGVVCGGGERCEEGACALSCQAGFDVCSDTCADLQADDQNCGVCGRECEQGEQCEEGTCALACGRDQTLCGARCVDTDVDLEHCGACDAPCGVFEICDGGECALECPETLEACGETCVDVLTSQQHCGDCDMPCQPGELCDGDGMCALNCQASFLECDGACVDPMNNPAHCGACGETCQSINGTASCAAGACAFACDVGWRDCDDDGETGCEAYVPDDDANCGACGVVCLGETTCLTGECRREGCALPGWSGAVQIDLDNPGVALGDVTIGVELDTAALIAAGSMVADCSDLRFVDASGAVLPHWVELGCDSVATQVWVRLSSLEVGGSTIHALHGQQGAASVSDGEATFILFNDFTSVDISPWVLFNEGFQQGHDNYIEAFYEISDFISPPGCLRFSSESSCNFPPFDGVTSGIEAAPALPLDSYCVDFSAIAEVVDFDSHSGSAASHYEIIANGVSQYLYTESCTGRNCTSFSGWRAESIYLDGLALDTLRFSRSSGDCTFADTWLDDMRVRHCPVAGFTATPQPSQACVP